MPTGPGWTITGYKKDGRYSNPIYKYDADAAAAEKREALDTPERQAARATAQGTRDMVTDLYNRVGETYTKWVNAGRNAEAAQLRDAAERFARAGSRTGASSEQRIASLQKLAGQLSVGRQEAEGKRDAAGISQSLSILDRLIGMDQDALASASRDAYASVSSSSSGSGAPRSFSGGGVRSTPSSNPLVSSRASSVARTATQSRLSEAQKRRDARGIEDRARREREQVRSLNTSNERERRSFFQKASAPPPVAPFSSTPFPTDNRPRQWGEVVNPGVGFRAPDDRASFNGGGVLPSYGVGSVSRPQPAPVNQLSGKGFDFSSKTSPFTGKYSVNPITGKRTLVASGNR